MQYICCKQSGFSAHHLSFFFFPHNATLCSFGRGQFFGNSVSRQAVQPFISSSDGLKDLYHCDRVRAHMVERYCNVSGF